MTEIWSPPAESQFVGTTTALWIYKICAKDIQSGVKAAALQIARGCDAVSFPKRLC